MRFLFALLLLLLSACAPIVQFPAASPHLNLQGPPPDVVVIAVSGRCGPPCLAPRDNWDYLASRGTLDAVADAIAEQGYSVQVASYAGSALATYKSIKVGGEQHGYAALVRDFTQMKAEWFGKPHAPRLVLLGHSHGSVWLHHLARVNPYIPFALQIDLDGICASWTLDHRRTLEQEKIDLPGDPLAINACEGVNVAGKTKSAKDVVWPNVQRNLEIQSKRLPARISDSGGFYLNYLFDLAPNLRPDGSSSGIERYISPREDHSAISYPNSDAIQWVLEKTRSIVKEWQVQDGR